MHTFAAQSMRDFGNNNRKRMPARRMRTRRGAIGNRIKSDNWHGYTESRTIKGTLKQGIQIRSV